jgi:hypothetical protein
MREPLNNQSDALSPERIEQIRRSFAANGVIALAWSDVAYLFHALAAQAATIAQLQQELASAIDAVETNWRLKCHYEAELAALRAQRETP